MDAAAISSYAIYFRASHKCPHRAAKHHQVSDDSRLNSSEKIVVKIVGSLKTILILTDRVESRSLGEGWMQISAETTNDWIRFVDASLQYLGEVGASLASACRIPEGNPEDRKPGRKGRENIARHAAIF